MFEDIIRAVNERVKTRVSSENDYVGEDGLLHCGECREPKQCRVAFPEREMTVYCVCACEKQRIREAERRAHAREHEIMRRQCFANEKFRTATLETDDRQNESLSRMAAQYADSFTRTARWLLLHGSCGTGKSHAAAMITNRVIEQGYSARFITVSEAERLLWNAADKWAAYRELLYTDLLVIDDLGAERSTEFTQEIRYNLIDGRLRTGMPCIITTNLTLQDLFHPGSQADQRLFSRLCECAIPFAVNGRDRRREAFLQNGRKPLSELLTPIT